MKRCSSLGWRPPRGACDGSPDRPTGAAVSTKILSPQITGEADPRPGISIFQRTFGRDVTLIFSADETAREVAETLERKGFDNAHDREGVYRFLTTGDPDVFHRLGERFLQFPIAEVEQVAVAELEAAA